MKVRNFKISFIAAWYDLWIGAYYNREHKRLYILPVPCLGICIEYAPKPATWRRVEYTFTDKKRAEKFYGEMAVEALRGGVGFADRERDAAVIVTFPPADSKLWDWIERKSNEYGGKGREVSVLP
jgi:hypothetical protein